MWVRWRDWGDYLLWSYFSVMKRSLTKPTSNKNFLLNPPLLNRLQQLYRIGGLWIRWTFKKIIYPTIMNKTFISATLDWQAFHRFHAFYGLPCNIIRHVNKLIYYCSIWVVQLDINVFIQLPLHCYWYKVKFSFCKDRHQCCDSWRRQINRIVFPLILSVLVLVNFALSTYHNLVQDLAILLRSHRYQCGPIRPIEHAYFIQ